LLLWAVLPAFLTWALVGILRREALDVVERSATTEAVLRERLARGDLGPRVRGGAARDRRMVNTNRLIESVANPQGGNEVKPASRSEPADAPSVLYRRDGSSGGASLGGRKAKRSETLTRGKELETAKRMGT
jgi:hypothetical protein